MRILYFSPRQCWPLTTGARLRDYHLARQLAGRASVTYLGLTQPDEEAVTIPVGDNPFEKVVTIPKNRSYTTANLVRGLIGPDPVTVLNYYSPHVSAALEDLLRNGSFHSIQIEGVHLLGYLGAIRAAAPRSIVIADWHNIESEIMRRYAETCGSFPRRLFATRTARLIEFAELKLLKGCDVHSLASDRERQKLMNLMPNARLETIPNGVDVEYYRPAHAPGEREVRREILFVGSMDYHANIDAAMWFVREIWPLVRTRAPGLRLTIAGRDPVACIRNLAAADIAITGTVSDIRPFYSQALAVVAPLRIGSGTRLKILEAMAAGVPVVSTRLGAEGLDVIHGENILIADTPEETVESLSAVLTDPAFRSRLVMSAQELVSQSYDWRELGQRLFQIHSTADRAREIKNQ